jgi:ribokinase
MRRLDIIAIGDLNWDTILQIPRLPGPDEEVPLHSITEVPGGDTANFTVACARLGMTVGIIGAVGQDWAGQRLREHLESAGVVAERLRTIGEVSGRAYSLVEPNGTRRLLSFRGANAAWELDEADRQQLMQAGWIYIADPLPALVTRLGSWLCQGQVCNPVALDPGSVGAARGLDFFAPLIPYIKVLFANEGEARTLTGLTLEEAALKLAEHIPLVAIKRGEQGCWIVRDKTIIAVSAFPVATVDTTGCGDAFNAAFLYRLQQGGTIEEAAFWGNAAGAIVAQRVGTGSAMPYREEVITFLLKYKSRQAEGGR